MLPPRARQRGRLDAELPARFSFVDVSRVSRDVCFGPGAGVAQVVVLFPVCVGGQLGHAAEARLALAQGLDGLLTLRDVARHAVITLEATLVIENRRAACAVVADLAVQPQATVFEIPERTVRRKIGLMLGPGAGQGCQIAAKLPACLADPVVGRVARDVLGERRRCIAQILVLLPETAGVQLREGTEARLTLTQRIDEPLALGDVANDADDPLRQPFLVAKDFPPGADPAWLLGLAP